MSTSVDTGAEGTLSTIVACGVKPGYRLLLPVAVKELRVLRERSTERETSHRGMEEIQVTRYLCVDAMRFELGLVRLSYMWLLQRDL